MNVSTFVIFTTALPHDETCPIRCQAVDMIVQNLGKYPARDLHTFAMIYICPARDLRAKSCLTWITHLAIS
eukprot:4654982-Amphidinium_carterae.2